jgi:hypothetical protein
MIPRLERHELLDGVEKVIFIRQCNFWGFYFENQTPIVLKIGGVPVAVDPPVVWESPKTTGGYKLEPVELSVTSQGANVLILETWS